MYWIHLSYLSYNLYLDSFGCDRTLCLLDSLDNPEACLLFLCGHREQDLRCSLSCTSFLCVFGLPHKIVNMCSRSSNLSNLVDLEAFERGVFQKKSFCTVAKCTHILQYPPGHLSFWQDLVSRDFPRHFPGAFKIPKSEINLHFLSLVCWPPPQDWEQELHGSHNVQLGGTGGIWKRVYSSTQGVISLRALQHRSPKFFEMDKYIDLFSQGAIFCEIDLLL